MQHMGRDRKEGRGAVWAKALGLETALVLTSAIPESKLGWRKL